MTSNGLPPLPERVLTDDEVDDLSSRVSHEWRTIRARRARRRQVAIGTALAAGVLLAAWGAWTMLAPPPTAPDTPQLPDQPIAHTPKAPPAPDTPAPQPPEAPEAPEPPSKVAVAPPPPARTPGVDLERGLTLLDAGQYTDAAAAFHQEAAHTELRQDALFWEGVALVRAGATPVAIDTMEAFLAAYPDAPRAGVVHCMVGRLLEDDGKPARAQAHFVAAATSDDTRAQRCGQAELKDE